MALENSQVSGQLRGDINVTPMIDVLLVLLIIFMVIAPIVPHGLDAALPRHSTAAHPIPGSPIIVRILGAPDGMLTYKINQDNVSIDQLGARLNSALAVRADKVIFVKSDDDVAFSAIARVMDIGTNSGADHIGLLTSTDPL